VHVNQVGCSYTGTGGGCGTRAGLVGKGRGGFVVRVGVGDDNGDDLSFIVRWWWGRGVAHQDDQFVVKGSAAEVRFSPVLTYFL
jgi:hypothetical protein